MTVVAEIAVPPDVEVACASLELQAFLPAAARTRAFTKESLRRWGEGEELIEAAVLVVSELVTNAIRHGAADLLPAECGRGQRGPEPHFTLRLALRPDVLHIEVYDGSAILPVQRTPGRDDDCGRGLLIIAALAESWTCGLDPDGGKWVRAALSRVPEALAG
ncbi:ATP-binding protein [Streptomyces piniterrae]|uniref:ATP-binding protein n=1 Tax=Streptomyces piniterrae TaxID=2571125 RepID=A0A4U0MUB1_9ACTN|nr:ATP-binding protein [Streptomyces piniterrae]TJZ44559.1 ATP-binding protein [Streptomyces piniterrae]